MPIARVQDRNIYGGSGTQSLAFNSNVTAGSLIIVTVGWAHNADLTLSCSDTQGNTYTALTIRSAGATTRTRIFYAMNVNAGATTVTVTQTGASRDMGFCIVEISGIATSNAFDVEQSGVSSAKSVTSGSYTTTQADEYVIAFTCNEVNDPVAYTAGANHTLRLTNYSHFHAYEDRILSSTGSYTSSISWSGADTTNGSLAVATFKEAVAGAGGTGIMTANKGFWGP